MPRQRIQFHYSGIRFTFRDRNKTKRVVKRIFSTERRALGRLDYIFCNDQELLAMNRQWLDHDTYTDILTFDLSENKKVVTGEVYISIDRIRENAKTYGVAFQDELNRVIFHGALHLCGYRDKNKAQQREMRRKEDKWLESLHRST